MDQVLLSNSAAQMMTCEQCNGLPSNYNAPKALEEAHGSQLATSYAVLIYETGSRRETPLASQARNTTRGLHSLRSTSFNWHGYPMASCATKNTSYLAVKTIYRGILIRYIMGLRQELSNGDQCHRTIDQASLDGSP
jgi:hypothetical protein